MLNMILIIKSLEQWNQVIHIDLIDCIQLLYKKTTAATGQKELVKRSFFYSSSRDGSQLSPKSVCHRKKKEGGKTLEQTFDGSYSSPEKEKKEPPSKFSFPSSNEYFFFTFAASMVGKEIAY